MTSGDLKKTEKWLAKYKAPQDQAQAPNHANSPFPLIHLPHPGQLTRVCLQALPTCVLQQPTMKSTYVFSVGAGSDFSRQHELSSGFY